MPPLTNKTNPSVNKNPESINLNNNDIYIIV